MAIDWQKSANELRARIEANEAALQAKVNATPKPSIPAPPMSNTSSSGGGSSYSSPSAISVPAPQAPSTQLPSWMGNQYSQVPGTDYYSTNPSNPNASKYRADGSPVASVSFDHTATGGTKFDGYVSPEQFNAIRSMSDNQAGLSNYLENNKGSFVSNDSIYKNVPAPGNTGINPSAGIMASDKPWERSGFGSVYAPSSGTNGGWNPNGGGVPNTETRDGKRVYYPGMNDLLLTPDKMKSPTTALNTADTMANTKTWGGAVPDPAYGGRTSGAYNPTGQALDGYGFGYNPDRPVDPAHISTRAGSYGNSVPAPAAPQSMEDKIRAEVKARSDKQRAGIAGAVDYTKTGLKNSFDYTRQLETDERVLQDSKLDRTLNPFSGKSDYERAMVDRNRSIADTARDKDYNAEVGAADRRLADFESMAPEMQDAMFNELQRIERDYGLKLRMQDFGEMDSNRKFGLDAQGQSFNQGMAQKQFGLQEQGQYFNQDMAGKQLGLQSQGQSFNQGMDSKKFDWGQQMDVAGMTGNFDPYAAQKQKMQSNSAAWLKTTDTAERQRLAAENQTIGKSIGAYQDATGEWIYPQAQRTMAGQQQDLDVLKTQISQGNWNQKFDFEMQQWAAQNKLDWANMDLNTKKALAQIAIDQQQVAISQQNANTSSTNSDWARDPNNPDNMTKTPTTTTGQKQSGYIGKIDKIPSASRKSFFESEKNQIISDLGLDGYEKLKAYYKIY